MRDDAMTNKSLTGTRHIQKHSNDFENRNFGNFVNDFIFAK